MSMPPHWSMLVALVPIFLFSLCVHEFAHAWVAYRLGDPTAALQGRLTLQPMAHADLFGTLVLPAVCLFSGLPFFGWAKPVPVDTRYFHKPRRDMALVAAAGPFANFTIAFASTLVLAVAARTQWVLADAPISQWLQVLCLLTIQVNLFLGVFNLLPLPPLDGFNVIQVALPGRWLPTLYRLTPYSGWLLIGLLVFGGLRILAAPVSSLYRGLVQWVL